MYEKPMKSLFTLFRFSQPLCLHNQAIMIPRTAEKVRLLSSLC
uniref:Uncharacterized protein n=1 Tax=Anguilla anguilla TaxID=7936 RepID=A0A0E9VP92_ANGAN